MTAQQAKKVLEQDTEGSRGSKLEKGEIGPAVSLQGKEAALDKAENKGRVSVYMQVGRLPCEQGHDDSRYLSDIIRDHWANDSGVCKDA